MRKILVSQWMRAKGMRGNMVLAAARQRKERCEAAEYRTSPDICKDKTLVVIRKPIQLDGRMSFRDLGLSDEVIHGVQSMGYIDPTPIQLRAFPIVLAGRDIIGSAQTGTGKTAAFALPILPLLKKHGPLR